MLLVTYDLQDAWTNLGQTFRDYRGYPGEPPGKRMFWKIWKMTKLHFWHPCTVGLTESVVEVQSCINESFIIWLGLYSGTLWDSLLALGTPPQVTEWKKNVKESVGQSRRHFLVVISDHFHTLKKIFCAIADFWEIQKMFFIVFRVNKIIFYSSGWR